MITPFTIAVPDEVLADLRARIRNTRWPPAAPGAAWEQGADLAYLKELLHDWSDRFDWRARERELNRFHHFRAEIDSVSIHFVHERASGGRGIPLLLQHGWPSAFVEYLPLVPLLSEFDLVIPSLPGYGFSQRPARANYRSVAALWHKLMGALGYTRYGAGGGDFGAGVATLLALDQPQSVIGIHLSNLEIMPEVKGPLTEAERVYLAQKQRWDEVERGYSAIQSTKPQTVGFGLNDSPAGLAAYLVEKWRSWTDSGGNPDRAGREFLLTLLTIYWVTQSITTSMRDYFDNRWQGVKLAPGERVRVPAAIANFDHQFAFEGVPPREFAERLYDVQRWTEVPRGGHFAPIEEPELLARDISAFFTGRS